MSISNQKIGQRSAVWVAAIALVVQPQLLMAVEQAAQGRSVVSPPQRQQPLPRNSSSDIVLSEGGVLVGQVVNEEGTGLPMAPLSLRTGGKEITRLHSDRSGKFQVSSLKGGIYQVVSTGHEGVYRFWAPKTAPPAAQQGLTVVSRGDVVRGQYGPPAAGNIFSRFGQTIAEHPLITAGVIAAAIAVPLALEDDDPAPVEP